MNADGTNQQQLVRTINYEQLSDPAWSPPLWEPYPRLVVKAGTVAVAVARGVKALLALFERRLPGYEVTKIAYANRDFSISVINADGTNPQDFPSGTFWGTPAWSPDGTKIAVTLVDPNPVGWRRIAVMNSDGSGSAQLSPLAPAPTNTAADIYPAWSPDGTKIAFQSNRSGTYQVWVMNANGSGLVNLTNRTTGDDNSPTWSPDGTKIAFASDRSGKFDIWTMNENGTGLRNITQGLPGHLCANPAWTAAAPPPGPQP
jgi:Tol biopolymer transport system component